MTSLISRRAFAKLPALLAATSASAAEDEKLQSESLLDLTLETRPPSTVSAGRLIVPVSGGTFEGPRLKGTIVAPGGDWIVKRPDGSSVLDVRLMLQTDDAQYIYMNWRGIAYPQQSGALYARITPPRPLPRSIRGSTTWSRSASIGPEKAKSLIASTRFCEQFAHPTHGSPGDHDPAQGAAQTEVQVARRPRPSQWSRGEGRRGPQQEDPGRSRAARGGAARVGRVANEWRQASGASSGKEAPRFAFSPGTPGRSRRR